MDEGHETIFCQLRFPPLDDCDPGPVIHINAASAIWERVRRPRTMPSLTASATAISRPSAIRCAQTLRPSGQGAPYGSRGDEQDVPPYHP